MFPWSNCFPLVAIWALNLNIIYFVLIVELDDTKDSTATSQISATPIEVRDPDQQGVTLDTGHSDDDQKSQVWLQVESTSNPIPPSSPFPSPPLSPTSSTTHTPIKFCTTQSYFKVLYFNARSLLPKIDELRALCLLQKPHCVCIVESWISQDIVDSELFISNYSLLRLDRNRHGGGVLIYFLSTMTASILFKGSVDLELLIVSFKLSSFVIVVALMYRPPSVSDIIFDELFSVLCFYVNVSLFVLCSFVTFMLIFLFLILPKVVSHQ